MSPAVAAWIETERLRVEACIRAAFADVTRAGGVSWSESVEIDGYGSDEQRAEARAQDREPNWEALVDDPKWDVERGVGGFSFLDPIGVRYYLAPAMVRACRGGDSGPVSFALHADTPKNGQFQTAKKHSLLTHTQCHAVYRFLVFMVLFDKARGYEYGSGQVEWTDCLAHYWGQFASEVPSEPSSGKR